MIRNYGMNIALIVSEFNTTEKELTAYQYLENVHIMKERVKNTKKSK